MWNVLWQQLIINYLEKKLIGQILCKIQGLFQGFIIEINRYQDFSGPVGTLLVNVIQQSRQIQEKKKIKAMFANSGIKHKSATMLEVIRFLVPHFVLYIVTV